MKAALGARGGEYERGSPPLIWGNCGAGEAFLSLF